MTTIRTEISRPYMFGVLTCLFLFFAAFAVIDSGSGQERGGSAGERRPRWSERRDGTRSNGVGTGQERSDPSAIEVPPTEPIHSGFVILEGQYMLPPYTLRWQEDSLVINSRAVEVGGLFRRGPWAGRRRPVMAGRRIQRVEEHLRDDGMLLAFRDERAVVVPAFEALEILQTLLDKEASRAEKVEGRMSLETVRTTSGHWGRLLDEFESGPELAGRVERLEEQMPSRMRGIGESWGRGRGRTLIVSSLSVLLAAVAMTLLLTHRPSHEHGWRGIDDSEKGKRRVLWLVGLLVVLNVFDLVCTILAAEAGGFLEINPLFERHLGNPGAVIAFKSALVLGGATVLILCRCHRIVQVAAWGAALVYTVVTLRWAMVGLMFVF